MDRHSRTAVSVLALALALLASCSRQTAPVDHIPDGYASWRTTTKIRLDYPIPGHEDRFRIIHMNDLGFSFSRSPVGVSFPIGTTIVKQVFATSSPAAGEEPIMLTAMVKAPDEPLSRGGWLWIVKDLAKGQETVFGGDFCYACHGNANEAHPYGDKNQSEEFRDYVFFVPGLDGMTPGAATDAPASPR